MDLPKQIIFCVETKDTSLSDCIYIKEIVNYYFGDKITVNRIKITFIPMGGKHGFRKVENDVKEKVKLSGYKSKVIYVFDKDKNNTNHIDQNFINDVTKYCERNSYYIAWFVKDIESVMLGRKSANKTKDASEFKRKNGISLLKTNKLKNINPQTKTSSNILCILENILDKSSINIE